MPDDPKPPSAILPELLPWAEDLFAPAEDPASYFWRVDDQLEPANVKVSNGRYEFHGGRGMHGGHAVPLVGLHYSIDPPRKFTWGEESVLSNSADIEMSSTVSIEDMQHILDLYGAPLPGTGEDPMPNPEIKVERVCGLALNQYTKDAPSAYRVYTGETPGAYVEVEANTAQEALEKAVQKEIIEEIVDPDAGLILSERARDPIYVRDVLLTLYDGRMRVVDDDDFAMALWKLRAHGCVGWCGPGSPTPGRPARELTEVGRRLAERELTSNPTL